MEKGRYFLVVSGYLAGEILVGGQHLAQADKSAHDGDVDIGGSIGAENA